MHESRCQYCGERSHYWHLILCEKNPTRVLSWDGWKIGERAEREPPKKGKK